MTAKEMMIDLNYKITLDIEDYLVYTHIENNDLYIEFLKKYKVVGGLPTYDYFCDMPLLKAINQQCKELGWLDE